METEQEIPAHSLTLSLTASEEVASREIGLSGRWVTVKGMGKSGYTFDAVVELSIDSLCELV